MFGFLKFGKKKTGPVICARKDHCISRKNIDPNALKVLYRLSHLGYTAYLVGGGVRDLLLGRTPKDFDVGTSAKPNEVKRAFRNCFLVGKRFRLALIHFGHEKQIETATFRRNSQTVGEIIERAAEGPFEDNTFGTPETDAYRRDFTVNGLFYDIKTFAVIDYVGGLEDIKKKVLRCIGDPSVRFREDPVRMMRAVKFSSRLGFKIDKASDKAIRELHSFIKTASVPRLCEEVFRLFPYGSGEKAFRLLWDYGLLGDILPELSAHIDRTGGAKAPLWKYLAVLDRYDKAMTERGYDVSNSLRLAVLFTTFVKESDGRAREAIGTVSAALKIPKAVYFSSVSILESVKRLSASPAKGRRRYVYNKDFPDALDYNRIVARAENLPEDVLNEWAALLKPQSESKQEGNTK